MALERMNPRALETAIAVFTEPQQKQLIMQLYRLLANAEADAFKEGIDNGYAGGFNFGWQEGYAEGCDTAVDNIHGSSVYEDIDVASTALDMDPALMLPPYSGDSGDER